MPSPPRRARAPRRRPAAAGALVEVSVRVPVAEADRAAAVLRPFAPSGAAIDLPFVQGEDFGAAAIDPEGRARVRCYFPAGDWASLRPRVRRALDRAEWTEAPPRLASRRLRARDWAGAWRAQAKIERFGRLVIRPTSVRYRRRADDVVVDLDPGMAFGTGSHPTTGMALAALERCVRPRQRVLDVGTGSGILALAAARLGAVRVDAVDIDPLAVEAARGNVERNALAEVVTVYEGRRPARRRYDVVVANITAHTIVALAPELAAATRVGGLCLLGGFTAPQAAGVRRAAAAAGLRPEETCRDGDWRSLRAVRPG